MCPNQCDDVKSKSLWHNNSGGTITITPLLPYAKDSCLLNKI